jgi:hypothetical protein
MVPKDVGLFVGRYFQLLGWLVIGWMAVGLIFYDRFHLDLTFLLLFWAAVHLKKHNPTARKWTLRLAGFFIGFPAILLVHSALVGTDGIRISLGRPIENPTVLARGGADRHLLGCFRPTVFAAPDRASAAGVRSGEMAVQSAHVLRRDNDRCSHHRRHRRVATRPRRAGTAGSRGARGVQSDRSRMGFHER